MPQMWTNVCEKAWKPHIFLCDGSWPDEADCKVDLNAVT